tara:strand:- start:668 stop:889 length:222 start_codon:yes stop_codon:yes gene_type:complete
MDLKVTKIRYFMTRSGLGYVCDTNYEDIQICNDGYGGATFLSGPASSTRWFDDLTEIDLENLINIFEGEPCEE